MLPQQRKAIAKFKEPAQRFGIQPRSSTGIVESLGPDEVGWLRDAVLRSVPWRSCGGQGAAVLLCDLPQAHDRPVPHKKRGPDCQ